MKKLTWEFMLKKEINLIPVYLPNIALLIVYFDIVFLSIYWKLLAFFVKQTSKLFVQLSLDKKHSM